jgi:hypothetical protein
MNKVNVGLGGISRNTDDGVSKDGMCSELINARPKNGSIEPVGRPILERQFAEGKSPVFVHKNGTYEHLISYANDIVLFDSDKVDGQWVVKNTAFAQIPGVKQIQSVGNILVMATGESIHYAIFIGGEYTYLGDQIPEPSIRFSCIKEEAAYSDDISCNLEPAVRIQDVGSLATLNEAGEKIITNSFKASYYKLLQEDVYDAGHVIYPVLVRYAVRLFDESYVMHSSPLLVGEPNFIRMAVSKTKFDFDSLSVEGFTYKLIANPRTIGVRSEEHTSELQSHVASSVDIFVSRPFVINDLDSTIKTVTVLDKNNMMVDLPFKSESELLEEIGEISNFYLVKSIPIGDISNGFENIFAEGKAFKNLEQQEVATDDDFTRSRITGNLYTYNGKLHVGNIREKLAKPYPLGMFAVSDINEFTVNTEVHVKTESGMKIVHGASTAYGAMVSPYLSYPDSRAVKMIIYNDKYYDEIPLKPHPFLNIAYSLKGLYPHSITDKYGTYTPLPEDSVSVAPNKLKVSNVSNPFYFPAKQTYTVSSRNIVAMATATTALSTGQFGQFPLYVFTGEGVFALSVGTGDIAYANSFSVTRDVCNNPDSIVSTDDAIVFSTDSGLKVLSGSTVRDISSDMEGYLPTAVDSSPIIKKIAGVGGFSDKLSSTEFIYYLEEAKVGYNYEDKEVIVANRNYPYSYVFNMQSGSWYKISASINRFLNSYPECLAVFNDHGVYNMHNRHRTVNKILLLTRPIKFGTLTHKRIVQSAIRGVIRPSESLVYFRGETVKFRDQEILAFSKCGFYVLGSNDAEHFILLSGREKIEDVRDLITKMNKTKAFKYFMIALVGGVRTDVALNYIEFMVDETYTNRLR